MEKYNKNKRNILLSLKKGDEEAFRKILEDYNDKLYYFIFSIAKSDYVSEEILQEVFIRVWTHRKSIDVSRSFDSFIYTIARNLTYNFLRNVANRESLKRELWKNITYFNKETEDTLLLNEYQEIVDDILSNLPKQKRSIFILSKREGKSNQEIADLLGISPKTVKNHLWKTLQLVKIQLQPHINEVGIISILITMFFKD